MKTQPLVSIIILGWNNYADIINCLKSLQSVEYKNCNIFLIDNGSKEGEFSKFVSWLNRSKLSYKFADSAFRGKKIESSSGEIFIVKNESNIGFTGGNNIGLAIALKLCNPKYILLLNGDTLVTNNFLSPLVEACDRDDKIGSAQSVLIRFDKRTIDSMGIEMVGYRVFDSCGGEDKTVLSHIDDCSEIFGSCGASALYRVDLIRRIGLFDESLFATFEDFDLAWKIRLSGYKSVLIKGSIVYHRGGVSRVRGNHKMFDMRSYLGAKNSLVMFNRYYPINFRIFVTCFVRLGIGFISALKNRKAVEFVRIIYSLPRERREILRNSKLKKIQEEWIK